MDLNAALLQKVSLHGSGGELFHRAAFTRIRPQQLRLGSPAVMDRWRGRVALVTGASLGRSWSGTELAAECQTAGLSGIFVPFKCDLSNTDEIQSMFSFIKQQHEGVDVCINNAGLAHPEPLLGGKTSGWKNMLDYAVTALTEGLRQELREANTHVRATCISPGVVQTELIQQFYKDDPVKAAAVDFNFQPLQTIDIANAVSYILSAPPNVQIGDIQMRAVGQVS